MKLSKFTPARGNVGKLPALQLTKAADKTKLAIVPNTRLVEAARQMLKSRPHQIPEVRTGYFDGFSRNAACRGLGLERAR